MTKPKLKEDQVGTYRVGVMKDHTIYVCSTKQGILDGRNDTVVDSLP